MGAAAALAPYAPRIDLARYDRAPEFTPEERRALAAWSHRQGHGKIRHTLARLHRPLSDVLTDATGTAAERVRTIFFVFRTMQRTGTPFWVWDDQQWLDLMGEPQPGRPFVRPHLLAIAYQLTGFSRLDGLRRMRSFSVTARLVFGREPFNEALEQLRGALKEVGYGATTVENNVPMVLAIVMLEARDPRLEAIDAAVLERLRFRQLRGMAVPSIMMSSGLAALGILKGQLPLLCKPVCPDKQVEGIDPEWTGWCRRWLRIDAPAADPGGTLQVAAEDGAVAGQGAPRGDGPWPVDARDLRRLSGLHRPAQGR